MARILALALVVAGHLALAVIDRNDRGAIRGTNLLLLHPRWSVLAAVAPMPVFFAAGGWANATTPRRRAGTRLRTLVGLATAVVACWSVAVLVATVIRGGDAGVIGAGARLATQPLWFLAAYLPFAYWGRTLARIAAARPITSIGGCVVMTSILDLIHFGLDGPAWMAWPAFFFAWGTPWLVGAWWRDRWTRGGFFEQRVGLALAVGAGFAAWTIVALGGYQASLIDYGSDGRSNTNPPTLYTVLAGLAQVGVLIMVARALDHLGARFRAFWDRTGSAAMAVYAWHLTALSLCVSIVTIPGVPAPRRSSASWWYSRPLWYVAVLGSCALLVGATAWVQARLRARPGPGPGPGPGHETTPTDARLTLGTLVAATGGAVVGLYGPATAARALVCCALLGTGWALLRGTSSA